MKRPLLNKYQRFEIKRNTHYNSGIKLHLAWLHFKREIDRIIKNFLKCKLWR